MSYILFQETYQGENSLNYISYGIKKENFEVHDISTNKLLVEKLTDKLNKYDDVSDEHLYDIIDDFIASL